MSAFTSVTVDAGQTWDAQDYAIDAGFVPVLGSAIARLLDARRGERILDLGCGDGVLSTELALTGAQVIGVDASPELVIAARHLCRAVVPRIAFPDRPCRLCIPA